MAKTGGTDVNQHFSPLRLIQLNLRDLESGANGVDDCGFHRSSSSTSTSTGRGRMVATAPLYMKVNFEGNLHF
jgi:hypothetical protein